MPKVQKVQPQTFSRCVLSRKKNGIASTQKTCISCKDAKSTAVQHCARCKNTPLCNACLKTQILNYGSVIDATGALKYSCATCRNHVDVIPSLLLDAEVKSKLLEMFMRTVRRKDMKALRSMLKHYPWLAKGKTNSDSPMHIAAGLRHIPIMKLLHEYGASMFDELQNGRTPLQLCINLYDQVRESICDGNDAAAIHFIEQNPEVVNYEPSNIPISHIVASCGSQDLQMKVFSNPDTDVNLIHGEEDEIMALYQYENLSIEALKLIIHRPDFRYINHKNIYLPFSPLHYFVENICDDYGHEAKAIAIINDPKTNVALKDYRGRTALDVATRYGLTNIVELIKSKLEK